MKIIEDIEKMTAEELEAAALQERTPVPEGLRERLETALAAKAVVTERSGGSTSRRNIRISFAAIAAAAAIAAIVVIPRAGRGQLKDTYDDPALAYAQVEATFKQISEKMALGMDKAADAVSTVEKPKQIISKINSK